MPFGLVELVAVGLTLIFVVFAAIVVLVVAAVTVWRISKMMRTVQAVGAAHAAAAPSAVTPQHHGIALVGIITGGDDYGTYPPEAPRKMLASSWGIEDMGAAVDTIQGLLDTAEDGDALVFDRVRAAHLARAAAGAGYIDQNTSWWYVVRAGEDLQRRFGSWDEVGAAYLRAKNQWLSARGIPTDDGTEANVEKLRQGLWRGVPFHLPLVA